VRLTKIISGGQTGADQGGLDAALDLGLKTGGWAPKGWLTEGGPEPELGTLYGLVEHRGKTYPPRTRANVAAAPITIWFGNASRVGGYVCTKKAAAQYDRPFVEHPSIDVLRDLAERYDVWNVAGHSESRQPGIYLATRALIYDALAPMARADGKL
jgi:hypothetical protein